MNTKLKILSSVGLIAIAVLAGPSLADNHQPKQANESIHHQCDAWQASFTSVPEVLLLHFPQLKPGYGLLVTQIAPEGLAATSLQLQTGDVLLAVDQQYVTDVNSIPAQPVNSITVLRRGQITHLDPQGRMPNPNQRIQDLIRQAQAGFNSAIPKSAVNTSAFATGGEAVSMSQSGDKISLEMSLPGLTSEKIRFRGTRQSILDQLQRSNLPPAAKQRVNQALR